MNLGEANERGADLYRRVMDANNEAWLRIEQGGWLCRCGYANPHGFPCCTHCGAKPERTGTNPPHDDDRGETTALGRIDRP